MSSTRFQPGGRSSIPSHCCPASPASVQDVGGTSSLNLGGNAMLTTHGGRNNDMRVTIDGLSTANAETSGNSSNFLPNMGSTQEISVDYAAGAAELPTGGVRVNMIPREGGNRFAGSFFGTAVNSSFQGEQRHPGAARSRPAHAGFDQADLRPQSVGRRSSDEGPPVVVCLCALERVRQLRRHHVLQQERR